MASGFDTSNLDEFTRDLLSLAQKTLPKETKKFLKKSATKLSKVQKKEIKSLNLGEYGEFAKLLSNKTKAGKVYKKDGGFNCRAYSGAVIKGKGNNFYSLSGMINNGYVHRGGVNKDGAETFINGLRFMEKSEEDFKPTYSQDLESFVDDMLDNHNL